MPCLCTLHSLSDISNAIFRISIFLRRAINHLILIHAFNSAEREARARQKRGRNLRINQGRIAITNKSCLLPSYLFVFNLLTSKAFVAAQSIDDTSRNFHNVSSMGFCASLARSCFNKARGGKFIVWLATFCASPSSNTPLLISSKR